MDWNAIGAVGETLGAAAVFATLVYLAAQVRHARTEVARSVSQQRLDTLRELNLTLATDERICCILEKAHLNLGGRPPAAQRALMERAGLTLEEARAFVVWQAALWQYRVQTLQSIDELPPGQRAEFEVNLSRFYSADRPAERLWYESMKTALDPDAVRYIDDLMTRRGAQH